MPARGDPRLEPLGNRAILATFSDELVARHWADTLKSQNWPAVIDIVIAYQSVAVHLNTALQTITTCMQQLSLLKSKTRTLESRLHIIPCCYELGEDLVSTANLLKIKSDELIAQHLATTFTIFAIGFSPGFPYLGWLPQALQGIPRRSEPRLRVPAGSVAIVGRQSCIYPQSTPGGWALIGRTPTRIVNLAKGYFPLAVGDQLRFERIDQDAFHSQHEVDHN